MKTTSLQATIAAALSLADARKFIEDTERESAVIYSSARERKDLDGCKQRPSEESAHQAVLMATLRCQARQRVAALIAEQITRIRECEPAC